MSNKLISIGLSAALTLSIGLLGKVGCSNAELEKRTSQLNAELMKSDLELGRAETRFGNASDYAKDLEQEVQDEIKARKAEVTRYGKLRARYRVLKKNQKSKRTKIVFREGPIIKVPLELKLTTGLLYQARSRTILKPIDKLSGEFEDDRIYINGKVSSYPNDNGDVTWEFGYQLHLKLEAQFIETITPSGAINHYAKLYEIDSDGKRIGEFEIDKFDYVINNPSSKRWFWWSPHLDIGMLGVFDATNAKFLVGGSLGVSMFGYGLTKNDLDWRVLRMSFDLSDNLPGVGFSPVLYNLGSFIPLISNIWTGPHLSYGLNGKWKAGLVIGAVL